MKDESRRSRRPLYRPALTRFARILLTLGSGESLWLILAFVLGVAALGVFSNFVFTAAYDPPSLTWGNTLRVLVTVIACVLLAYLTYRYDLRLAWESRRFDTIFDERVRAGPHPGLIWLLSPGSIDLPLSAIQYHQVADSDARLRHGWLLITPGAQETFERLAARIDELGYGVELHPIALEATTIEATYRAVDRIYRVEAEPSDLRPDDIMADLTGGLKTMTAGMVMACLSHGRPLEYIESNRNAEGHPIAGTQRVIKVGVDFTLTRQPDERAP